MKRREFVTLLGGAAAVWPLAAQAQQGERARRIGILNPFGDDDLEVQANVAAFRQTLKSWVGPTAATSALTIVGAARTQRASSNM